MSGNLKSALIVICITLDAVGVYSVRPRTHADGNAGANSRADRSVNPHSDSHA